MLRLEQIGFLSSGQLEWYHILMIWFEGQNCASAKTPSSDFYKACFCFPC